MGSPWAAEGQPDQPWSSPWPAGKALPWHLEHLLLSFFSHLGVHRSACPELLPFLKYIFTGAMGGGLSWVLQWLHWSWLCFLWVNPGLSPQRPPVHYPCNQHLSAATQCMETSKDTLQFPSVLCSPCMDTHLEHLNISQALFLCSQPTSGY